MKYIFGIAIICFIIMLILIGKCLIDSDKNQRNNLIDYISRSNLIIDTIKSYIENNRVIIDSIYKLDYQYFKTIYKRELQSLLLDDINDGKFKNIKDGLPENLVKFYSNSVLKDAIIKAIDESYVEEMIMTQFMQDINSNIHEANQNEEDAIEYHKQFGIESFGDPELHPKETNNDASSNDDSSEKTLADLLSTGTVEDVD